MCQCLVVGMITRRLAHCQQANSFCKTEKCSPRREDQWIRDACFHTMWKSFADCRNTLSFYHFLFLHLLALFRCNGNSKSIWNWFLEQIQHTVCTSIVGFCDNFIEKAMLCLSFSCWNLQITTTTTPRLLRHQQSMLF